MLSRFLRPFSTSSVASSVSANALFETSLKSIRLRTCVGLYDELAAKYPHIYSRRPLPANGVDLSLSFVDTIDHTPNATKTVLAIHGGIGDFTAFKQLIQYFISQNVRVIVPKFPTFETTRENGHYWHGTDEKAAVVSDLVRELGIPKIDLLTAHSQGAFTAAALAVPKLGSTNPLFKSLAFLAPYYDVQIHPLTVKLFVALSLPRYGNTSELFWDSAGALGVYKLPIFGFNFRTPNEQYQLCTTLIENQDVQTFHKRLQFMGKQSTLPVLTVYGTREKTIHRDKIDTMLGHFDFRYKDVKVVGPAFDKAELERTLKEKMANAVLIENGGHFVHQHCPDVCNNVLHRFMS